MPVRSWRRSLVEHFAAGQQRVEDQRHRRLGGDGLLDRAVADEFELVEPRAGVVLDRKRIQHGAHGAADQRLAEIVLAERAALGHEHDQRDLRGRDQRGQHIGERGKARGLHQHRALHAAHPGAGGDADGFLLARGREGGEEGIGVQVLDQRGQHAIGHIGHQGDVVPLQGLQHDAVPGLVLRLWLLNGLRRSLLLRECHPVLPFVAVSFRPWSMPADGAAT